jgi:hypothetical protein
MREYSINITVLAKDDQFLDDQSLQILGNMLQQSLNPTVLAKD